MLEGEQKTKEFKATDWRIEFDEARVGIEIASVSAGCLYYIPQSAVPFLLEAIRKSRPWLMRKADNG
jgi:hypothetical protein